MLKTTDVAATIIELVRASYTSLEEKSSAYQSVVKPSQYVGLSPRLKENIIKITTGTYKKRYTAVTKAGNCHSFQTRCVCITYPLRQHYEPKKYTKTQAG